MVCHRNVYIFSLLDSSPGVDLLSFILCYVWLELSLVNLDRTKIQILVFFFHSGHQTSGGCGVKWSCIGSLIHDNSSVHH